MANKKKRKRTPIAPKLHSAPGTAAVRPSAPPPPAGAARPAGAQAPTAPSRPAPKPRKQSQSSRAALKKKRARQRNYLLGTLAVLALIAAIVVPRILSGRDIAALNSLGDAARCGNVETTADSGAGEHLAEGESTEYDPLPPSHGPHSASTLPAGTYDEPLSEDANEAFNVYKAVHSLEHGAVIVWHNDLPEDDLSDLTRTNRDEKKVIIAPFAKLPGDNKMTITAWGKSMSCEKSSTQVVEKFIEIYRGARTAPEPNNPI